MFVELVYDKRNVEGLPAHAKSSSMNSQNAYINFFPMRK